MNVNDKEPLDLRKTVKNEVLSCIDTPSRLGGQSDSNLEKEKKSPALVTLKPVAAEAGSKPAQQFLAEKAKDRVNIIEKLKREEAQKKDQTGFDPVYKDASVRYGIPWEVLSAIHKVESNRRGNTGLQSYAGASGPMQFLPSTFRRYGVDGDNDGRAVIRDVDDAIYSAANYLAANNGNRNIQGALYHYNHSGAYVGRVLAIARSLGYRG